MRTVEGTDGSFKYEDIYLKDYGGADELYEGLSRYFAFYDHVRVHQSLGYQTPAAVYQARGASPGRRPKPR